ncbi:MAG: DNA-processing protein DprA [Armatimonadetes bacterium]|nr:DNA-processing protein DprA [Armatimonadota bacterium]
MRKGETLAIESAVCALYLRGSPIGGRAPRRAWPRVVARLCSAEPTLDQLGTCLLIAGLYDEASLLGDPGAIEWGLQQVESDRTVTVVSPTYPSRWLQALGSAAPPALWRFGTLPLAPAVGVAGGRQLSARELRAAAGIGAALMALGRTLVSGGASGADRAAAAGAIACGTEPRVIEILPCGVDMCSLLEGACSLSASAPDAEFSTGQAMERNALIYAYGTHTVVIRPRYRVGGTWHGATDALRRDLSVVGVWGRGADAASEALTALGAVRVPRVRDLAGFLATSPPQLQPWLFGAGVVRERSASPGWLLHA